MTPRELTAGAIRSLPGTLPAEHKQHGPITDLVRKDRCGVVVYEGRCDGKAVCLVEHAPGHWVARSHDGVVAAGTLVEVLGVQVGDEWMSATGACWTITAVDSWADRMEATGDVTGYRMSDCMALCLATGRRPVAT